MCMNLVITGEADDVSVPTGRALTERILSMNGLGLFLKLLPGLIEKAKSKKGGEKNSSMTYSCFFRKC